ncbi:MAG: serine/threonine-protein phosphatase, partial [Eubacterium sp.]|nr:serine/threonine-protein phosphatase [Eubacterium sp.]
STLQMDMVPNKFPAFPERDEFDLFASMTPAKEVGGDFYDFFLIDDDHLYIVIADVSGKGIPAAMFMILAKGVLANQIIKSRSPAQALADANEELCRNNTNSLFVTVWLGILTISTGKLVAANAGHEFPVIKDPGGSFEYLKDKHGLVLGGRTGMKYTEYEIDLKPGSKLFVYTDGAPEANNEAEEQFGADRLLSSINQTDDPDPKEIISGMRSAIEKFTGDAEQFDDLTMLCLKYIGK